MIKGAVSLACAAMSGAPFHADGGAAEVPVEAEGPHCPLAGTMLRGAGAQGSVAGIILGSGATDRDGSHVLGVRAGGYLLLAQGLAGGGIATVRIDKRGMFGSAGAVLDGKAVTSNDS